MSSIALVLIARNEARCIERCLASARAFVDTMIVLDTGSDDDTRACATRAGARVVAGTWHDDFARARNDALALADQDWVLMLDADEWIVDGTEALTGLRGQSPTFLGVVTVENLFDDARAGTALSPSWIPRVLPRGVLYEGRIHEQPCSVLPRRRLGLRVRHDGYLTQVMQAKRGRNRQLLVRAIAESPGDAYLRYQFGKDFELTCEWDAAAAQYGQALAGCADGAVWRHDLVLRSIFVFKQLGRHGDALGLVQREAGRWSESPDFHFAIGDLLLDWAAAEPRQAAALVPMIDASWQRAVAIGERPELPDSVHGRGSYLAAHNLAVLHGGLGRHELAARWREREQAMRRADAGNV
ncbi:MAG: glycosyltransferase family 2 protein [Burkholderiaceae bacterium]|nr:glycosyltransferase family 2 protein [Burkholderiaceae bacterium]